jgi:hypothetical protein
VPVNNGNQDTIATAITDISDRLTRLVHDEIELAKTEITLKARSLAVGTGIFVAGAVFGVFALIFLLLTLALVLNSFLATGLAQQWIGFAIVLLGLVVATVVSVLIAKRLLQTGAPTPTMAIDEAKKIRDTVTASTEAEWLGVDR